MSDVLSIKPDQLDKAFEQILKTYGDEVSSILVEVADEVADETAKIVKESAPVATGGYAKKIKKKIEHGVLGDVHNFVHVADPDYRRAHLLEFGHAKVGGTERVAGKPHFEKGESYIEQNYEKTLKEKIEKV